MILSAIENNVGIYFIWFVIAIILGLCAIWGLDYLHEKFGYEQPKIIGKKPRFKMIYKHSEKAMDELLEEIDWSSFDRPYDWGEKGL